LKIISLVFLAILCGFCADINAQNPYIRHFTTNDGLPTNTIYQIYQDSHKFLWFTSDAGVVKFDGSNFTSYRKKDGLSSNDVVRIKEDSKGRIWFFNYNATVNYLYNNKIYNNNNAPFLSSLIGKGFIMDFYSDANQTLYFYNWQRELFSLDTNNKVSKDVLFKNMDFRIPFLTKNLFRLKVLYINKNEQNEWTIYSNGGIYKQDLLQKRKAIVVDSNLYCLQVFPTDENRCYVNTYFQGLLRFTGDFQKEEIPYPGDLLKIKTIIEDSEGYVWIAAYNEGVYCFKNNIIVRHFNIKNALGLLQDHEKNIWISSQSDGIYMINHDLLEQNHFDRSYFENNGINQLFDVPGIGVWCTNNKSAFFLKSDSFYKLAAPKEIHPVNIVYQFKNQTLVLGSISTRICTFENIQLKKSTNEVTYSIKTVYPVAIKKVIRDLSGEVIVMFDQNRLLFTTSARPSLKPTYKIISERINYAYYNTNNDLVVNSKRNYLYNNNRLVPIPELSRFNGSNITDHLFLDNSTELFNIDGDSLYILRNHKFYNLTNAFDTPFDSQIKKLLYLDSTLYLATLKEIFVCYKPLHALTGASVHLEPLNISFNNINDIIVHNDTLYVGSDDGLTEIAKKSLSISSAFPPIPYLQSIAVNDRLVSLPEQELRITGKNNIHLSFGCISYSTSTIIYSYMLQGAERKWTIGTGRGINLVYQNLPKGHYVFKLRVRKSNSSWSKPLELAITINPTLVERPIFWVFVALLASGLILLIITRIRAQKMKKVEVDLQLIVMEQKALQSMMNPHFIFNSLGSIQNYLLTNKGSEAVIYLSQFARLIRQNLNAVNTPMIILEEEVDRIKNYIDLEQKRLENKFEYEIENNLEEDDIYIPSMIIQPIAENSIWHGLATLEEKGFIRICFQSYKEKSLKIIIEDNGIGMEKAFEYSAKSTQRQHLGMQIIKKRLDLLSKKYKTETNIYYTECSPGLSNPGTRVEIILPFIYNIDDL
jgi:anti-sigma regulatory factor (Ser/Thr protein kinase)